MPFIDYNTKPQLKIWDGIHGALHHSDNITMGHITLEEGAMLPEHHHVHEQWTHIIEGEMEFTVAGETKVLTAGMTAYIPSELPHSGRAITKCKVIDCFRPVREDFKTLERWEPN